MGTSETRKRKREQQEANSKVAVVPPAPQAAPEPPSAVQVHHPHRSSEIDFMVPPGGLMQPEGAPPLAEKAKTVRVPGALNVHVIGFQGRHGVKRYSFVKVCLAMWRLLLREEHAELERARAAQRQTGLPAQPRMGALHKALIRELEEMRLDGSDD
ncbi:hypothetical protein [Streptomyces sp. NPDC088727]|uniref:hypothetical protein n=1 Tax=Streptomyces sp. NPDC088727 TaxID=3365875 RepID=UPI0037FE49B0